MAQHTPKHFFARTVTIPAATATLLSTLMAAAGWVETDSHEGQQCILKPATATLYIGDDENVSNASAPPLYEGVNLASGVSLNLAEYCGGIIDPYTVWLFSVGSQDLEVIFLGL